MNYCPCAIGRWKKDVDAGITGRYCPDIACRWCSSTGILPDIICKCGNIMQISIATDVGNVYHCACGLLYTVSTGSKIWSYKK